MISFPPVWDVDVDVVSSTSALLCWGAIAM
ncbi:predicted protein [Sclerotinia sclerotiorum 1980 UF-70]|uniref:Uncharacterized protein n=1 Tax=Sclerotinia sclerotiorum (strain ATCC 18683 / 1980 / Ss-1) TaxID=665079 RepID=A7EMG1_SCLS1|nr:predicted protein [Sclerotinia sclerotiorum 1980 UF-70]EDO04027.1 predicted protein [Sclerotinia sclerotiorum 1980 UF-70]